MNWNLIAWFAGVALTFAGLKFVWVFLRNICSKDNMESLIDAANNGVSNAGMKVGLFLRKKGLERKLRKEEERKPIVTIR